MKRKVLFVASLFLATATFAQDGLTSKKGEAILPEAGDWALGFDANPFISYFGNLANANTNNSMNAAWQTNDASIVGKYFKDETTAYRGRVRIGFNSSSNDFLNDTSTVFAPSYVEGDVSSTNFNLVLGAGIEKRKGNTRIQGYYGGELLIGFSTNSSDFNYDQDLSATNSGGIVTIVNTTAAPNVSGGGLTTEITTRNNSRVTSTSAGSTFGIGVRGFIGVEWFIFPKVSLGAEYGWAISFTTTGEGETDIEQWNGTSVEEETFTTSGSNSSFNIDTDNNGHGISGGSGQINLIFHF